MGCCRALANLPKGCARRSARPGFPSWCKGVIFAAVPVDRFGHDATT